MTPYWDNFIRNRNVILMGPAGYLDGLSLGSWIDSFELVLRVGHNIPGEKFEKDYGKRVDALFLDQPQFIPDQCPSRVRYIGRCRKAPYHWQKITLEKYYRIRNLTAPFGPTKGFRAIMDLLDSPAKKITLCGFSFMQPFCEKIYNPFYWPQPKHSRLEVFKEGAGNHSFPKEWDLIKEIYYGNDRLDVDPYLEKNI